MRLLIKNIATESELLLDSTVINSSSSIQSFGDVQGDQYFLNIPVLMEKCAIEWGLYSLEFVLIVNGKIVTSRRSIMSAGPATCQFKVIYLLPTDVGSKFEDVSIDGISLNAANDWINSQSAETLKEDRAYFPQLVVALSANRSLETSEPVQAPANPRIVAPQMILNVLELLQWRLIIRMIVIYFIYTHNRGMKSENKMMIGWMMLVLYIFQVGALRFIIDYLRNRYIPQPAVPVVAPGPEAVPQADAAQPAVGAVEPSDVAYPNVNNNPAVAGQVDRSYAQFFLEEARNICIHGVTIPTRPGAIYDFMAVIVGFFGSLFPSWQAKADAPPAAQIPPIR